MTWKPHPGPQTAFGQAWEFEVLYGGAAGGGKTDALIMEATRYVGFPEYNGILFRRTFPQLQEVLDRTRQFYPMLGGEYRAGEHRWYFPSGARINLGHMQNEDDYFNYQGKEFGFVGFDEAGQFLPKQYLYLFSRARSTNPEIKPQFRAATNPGGPGHQFLKDRFRISANTPNTTIYDAETGLTRRFIPAKLQDNPSLAENDPMYIRRLMMLPEIERLRLLEGVWDAFEGQVFIELNREIHGCAPFDIPAEWPRFRSFDWGYSAPYSVGWWAADYDGNIYRYRELYGGRKDEGRGIWVGTRETPTEIARKVKEIEREAGEHVHIGPADPSIWSKRRQKDGSIGISVAEEMSREGMNKIIWIKADNDRILGKQQIHSRLKLNEDGNPSMFIFNTCEHFWRTIPLLQEHPNILEDIDHKNAEDHVYDEVRYFCMFRPTRPKTQPRNDVGSFQWERRKLMRAQQHAAKFGVPMSEAYGRV